MYITYNNQTYSNVKRSRFNNGDVYFSGESLEGIGEVSGEIITYRNDGFELVRDNTEDYLRVVIQPQTIKLTNQPDVPPTPPEPSDTEVLNTLLGVNEGTGEEVDTDE